MAKHSEGGQLMSKVRKCISIDKDVVNYIDKISEEKNRSFSYIVNYYSKEFIKFHKEALVDDQS